MQQMFMEGALGGRLKTDKLKLSDFIDESFFEDMDLDDLPSTHLKKHASQLQLLDFVKGLKKNSTHILLPSPL